MNSCFTSGHHIFPPRSFLYSFMFSLLTCLLSLHLISWIEATALFHPRGKNRLDVGWHFFKPSILFYCLLAWIVELIFGEASIIQNVDSTNGKIFLTVRLFSDMLFGTSPKIKIVRQPYELLARCPFFLTLYIY